MALINSSAKNKTMSSKETKQWIKQAIIYAVENKDPNLDYSKYIAKNYIQHIEGKVFNYDQYVQHMQNIKALVSAMKVNFDHIVVEANEVAVVQTVKVTKKDDTSFTNKVMLFFKIENQKITYCEELLFLIDGNISDKAIGAMD